MLRLYKPYWLITKGVDIILDYIKADLVSIVTRIHCNSILTSHCKANGNDLVYLTQIQSGNHAITI